MTQTTATPTSTTSTLRLFNYNFITGDYYDVISGEEFSFDQLVAMYGADNVFGTWARSDGSGPDEG